MIKEILKKTGSLLILLTVLAGALPAKEVIIDGRLSSRRISVGERATLTLKIPGGQGDIQPVKVPALRGIRIDYAGAQHSFQYINGKSWRGVSLNFTIRALKPGTYRIPSFILQRGADRLKSKPVTLSVVKGSAANRSGGDGPALVSGLVELDKKKVHVGEPVLMRYYILSTSEELQLQGQSKPESKGCVINEVDEKREDKVITTEEGEMAKMHLATYVVVPALEGSLKIGGGQAVVGITGGRRFFEFMNREQVAFDTVTLKVVPLPIKGRPDNFSGNVGSYKLEVNYDKTPVKVYDERRIEVKVSGAGNIAAMARPQFGADLKDLRILAEEGKSSISLSSRGLEGEKVFYYTVIPEKSGKIELGAVSLNFYDNTTGGYRETVSEKILLTVTGDSGKNNRIDFDEEDEGKPSFNIAVIIFIVLLVSGAIVFMVLWERKRFKIISSDEPGETDSEEEETRKGDDAQIALASALESHDSDLFFKSADRILKISALDDFLDTGLLEDARNRLYGIRFGGGNLDEEAMNEIYRLLKDAGALKK